MHFFSRIRSGLIRFCTSSLTFLFTLLLSLFTLSCPVHAQAPDIAASAWLLLDTNSGQILYSRNIDAPVEPASLTKLMTAYLAFAAIQQKTLDLNKIVPVSEAAYKATGSRMFIDPKRAVTVDELLHGMIIQSGNDATIAIAEAVAGSESNFVTLMNREAQRMQLHNTRFTNASGLPDTQHVSTARDLAILATHLINDFPQFYPLYSQREYTYNGIRQPNRNRLLSTDPSVDGMKTGHTDAAGFCLISSAKRDGRRLLSVVLGTASDASRAQESLKLLNYGFQYFDDVRLYEQQQAVGTPQIWKGKQNTLKIGFQRDIYVTVPKGAGNRLKAQLALPPKMMAPFTAGQTVGKLVVSLDDKTLQELPVVVLEDVPQAGIFGRAWDSMKLWLK